MGKEKASDQKQNNKKRNKRIAVGIFVCIIGILVNYLGGWLANRLELPVYLDTAGTMFAAVFGGYIPAIMVGLLTNFIKSIYDPSSIYFGFINVLIAVAVSIMVQKGVLKKWYKVVLTAFLLSIIGGILGSLLSWFLYGFGGDSVTAAFSMQLYESTGMPQFLAHLCAGYLLDLLDKFVTVVFVFIVQSILPESIREKSSFSGWQQISLSSKEMDKVRRMKGEAMSLRTKILLILILIPLTIAILSTAISYLLYRENTVEEHKYLAQSVSDLAASMIDADMVERYISEGRNAPGYNDIEQYMYYIYNSSPDIKYVYVYKMDIDGYHVVFDLDTPGVPAEEPGAVVEYEDSIRPYVGDLINGEEIEPLITNDEFGFLLTVYKPVFNSAGKCACYVCVDVSMTKLQQNSYIFFAKLISLFLGFFVLAVAIGMWLAENNIILPVNTITFLIRAISDSDAKKRERNMERIKELDIHTGDEIENLYKAFSDVSTTSRWYIENLQNRINNISCIHSEFVKSFVALVDERELYAPGHIDHEKA